MGNYETRVALFLLAEKHYCLLVGFGEVTLEDLTKSRDTIDAFETPSQGFKVDF